MGRLGANMDEIFLRELIIFLAVCAIFIGMVPMMIRGHRSEPIEVAVETTSPAADRPAGDSARVSKKRRARARDAARKNAGS